MREDPKGSTDRSRTTVPPRAVRSVETRVSEGTRGPQVPGAPHRPLTEGPPVKDKSPASWGVIGVRKPRKRNTRGVATGGTLRPRHRDRCPVPSSGGSPSPEGGDTETTQPPTGPRTTGALGQDVKTWAGHGVFVTGETGGAGGSRRTTPEGRGKTGGSRQTIEILVLFCLWFKVVQTLKDPIGFKGTSSRRNWMWV